MKANETFDYIIVGAGAAGCVLANRLSENKENTVLLIENGANHRGILVNVALGMLYTYNSDKYNYHYSSEPEPQLLNRKIYTPRGKGLGGSTLINAMVYTRGNAKDYDHWADIGNKNWDYNSVLPYFKKSEDYYGADTTYHGHGGPMAINETRIYYDYAKQLITAAEKNHIPVNLNFNGAEQFGIGFADTYMKNGIRNSAKTAFLDPIRHRNNLVIMPETLVSKVLMDNHRAQGVEVIQQKQTKKFYAKKTVILSAGAINTPQLLLLSGIGPEEHLTKMKIKTKKHLPGVGKNLQDHLGVYLFYQVNNPKTVFETKKILFGWYNYLRNRPGIYNHPPIDLIAFLKSKETLEFPDTQLHFSPTMASLNDRTLPLRHGFLCNLSYLTPKSRGEITLKTNSIKDAPSIFYNYLSAPEDLPNILNAMEILHAVLNSDPIFNNIRNPYGKTLSLNSDKNAMENFIRQFGCTLYHPVGTCKMGIDEMAVVNPENLMVYGVENLMIADASVIPIIVRGNTEAVTLMIAEKACDILNNATAS